MQNGALLNIEGNKLIKATPQFTAIPDTVTTLLFGSFSVDGISEVIIPSNVKVIETSAFYASSLKKITIPETITSIGEMVFMNCKSLETVIWNSTLDIPDQAFDSCYNLTNISIKEGVKVINNAFDDCWSLMDLYVPSSITKFYSVPKNVVVHFSFDEATATEKLGVWNSKNAPVVYNSATNNIANDGCLYVIHGGLRYALDDTNNTARVTLQSYQVSGDITISSEITYNNKTYIVTVIDYSAFLQGEDKITSIIIPESVTEIGDFGVDINGNIYFMKEIPDINYNMLDKGYLYSENEPTVECPYGLEGYWHYVDDKPVIWIK